MVGKVKINSKSNCKSYDCEFRVGASVGVKNWVIFLRTGIRVFFLRSVRIIVRKMVQSQGKGVALMLR